MLDLKLHLEADTSIKALHTALTERGHDITRTPNDCSNRVSPVLRGRELS
ncbi:MAG: hypothetical protein AAGE59_12455 [Cyanobacteria bacterium P01_F01_bin.86]